MSGSVFADSSSDRRWQEAYESFETVEQERRKFTRRLKSLGVEGVPRDRRVLELFCGRGNALWAWSDLGFACCTGVDLAAELLQLCEDRAGLVAGDARALPISTARFDVVSVNGGLHHLLSISDLELVLREARRVLRPGGVLLVVEPWDTPFLRLVHAVCRLRSARRLWKRLDALATMIELEGEVYRRWLASGDLILRTIRTEFEIEAITRAHGKLMLRGRALDS